MKLCATMSICRRPHQFPPLQRLMLLDGASALLRDILRASGPAPNAHTTEYLSDWVMPSGDGWAPWSADDAPTPSAVARACTTLAVPSGDGWAPYPPPNDDGWLTADQLRAIRDGCARTVGMPTIRDNLARAADAQWRACLRLCADALEQGLDVYVAYQE